MCRWAWEATKAGDHAFEFVLLWPWETPHHLQTLSEVALQSAESPVKPTPGTVIDMGRPWIEDGEASHFLVSLPYPLGPDFEHVLVPEIHIRIFWLLPVTDAEVEFILREGVDAFKELAEEHEVLYADPRRPSLV
jgi:Suppressor of fused protein (SUFU)